MEAVRVAAGAHETLRPEGDYLQRAWRQSVYPIAARIGVAIRLPPVSPQPRTHRAFEGFQFVKDHGLANAYNHRVFTAFFVDGLNIGDPAILTQLAGEVGLDAAVFSETLRARRYREAHHRALHAAYFEAKVSGVPMFVIGHRVLTGLQDRETLEGVIAEEAAH